MNTIKMTNQTIEISRRTAAIIAGLSILILTLAAGFAYGYVFNQLVVPGNATETANNIKASETLFRAGIFAWLIILVCDVFAAWGFYIVFQKVNNGLSLLTAWMRLTYAAILGIAMLNFIFILILISSETYLTVFEINTLNSQILLSINAFEEMWSIGLIVFGSHLLTLGYLTFKSNFIPKVLGILVIIGAVGYLIIHIGSLIVPHFETYKSTIEMIFMFPMIVGELGLGLWLLFKKTI